MRTPERVIFTNMCMVEDGAGHVLVQRRVKAGWPGCTFPGGHVEAGEDFADAVIREVWEETGLTVSAPRLVGVKHWREDDGIRQVVLLYRASRFTGTVRSSEEGEVFWHPLANFCDLPLSHRMDAMLRVFLEEDISEMCFSREGDGWAVLLK